MKRILKKIKNFIKKYWQLIIGFIIGIIIVGGKREKDTLGNFSDNADTIISDNTARFRDRSEQVLRGIFSDRGHTNDPTDSRGTNSGNFSTNETGIPTSFGQQRPSDNESPEPSKDLADSGNNVNGNNRSNNDRHSTVPINTDDEGFFSFIEGPLLVKHGGHLFCLLAPLQMKYGRLVSSEIADIYNQGRKDPSIMDRFCVMGKKNHLLTYHAANILGADKYLVSCGKEECDFFITEWRDGGDKVFILYNKNAKKLFHSPKGKKKGTLISSNYYRWV